MVVEQRVECIQKPSRVGSVGGRSNHTPLNPPSPVTPPPRSAKKEAYRSGDEIFVHVNVIVTIGQTESLITYCVKKLAKA